MRGANPAEQLRSISRHYRHPVVFKSLTQLAVTLLLWLASATAAALAVPHGLAAVLAASTLSGCLLVRLFVIQHDCGHRAYFRSTRANDWVGRTLGVLTMTPYHCWRRFHALHHINSGNLDRRGAGDIFTLTCDEYRGLRPLARRAYRIYRHPLVLLVLAPPLLFILRQRLSYNLPLTWKAERRSVWWTNCVLLLAAALMYASSGSLVLVGLHLLAMSIASMLGVWLFYMQHQFADTYWRRDPQWESWRASMHGASYLELPWLLRWLTANIGLHHIHHLDAGIPNYHLHKCFSENPEFRSPPRLAWRDMLSCMNLKLWDESRGVMVPFGHEKSGKKESKAC